MKKYILDTGAEIYDGAVVEGILLRGSDATPEGIAAGFTEKKLKEITKAYKPIDDLRQKEKIQEYAVKSTVTIGEDLEDCEEGNIQFYLCQDYYSGSNTKDKKGYKYSWIVIAKKIGDNLYRVKSDDTYNVYPFIEKPLPGCCTSSQYILVTSQYKTVSLPQSLKDQSFIDDDIMPEDWIPSKEDLIYIC